MNPIISMFPHVLIWFLGLGFLGSVLFSFQIVWKQKQRLKKEIEDRISSLTISNNSLLKEISEREKVKNELRDTQDYLKAIYDATDNVAFVVTDLSGKDTKILDVSPGAERMFGYDRNEAIGEKVAIFHPQSNVEDFPKIQAELKGNKKKHSGETILIRKNGDAFPALFTIFPKISNNGDVIGTIGVSIDITERKKIEEALQSSEDMFSKAFQNAPILMTISSLKDGRYLNVNEDFVRVTGYKRNVVVGLTSVELGFITKEEREKIIRELSARGRVNDMELELTKADGSKMYCLYSAETITVSGKQRLLSLATDITDRKNMEARLLQAQKMESIGTLAGGIAHDFNNLLFPIIGMSELLLEDLPEGSLEAENVKEIFLAGKRAGNLVNQILAFSRQSEHKMAPVRLQNVLKEVLTLSRSTIPTSIEIHENIHQDCGLVMADPTQIHQVAMNLITNAFHAVEEKNGIISVQLEEITDSVSQSEKCIILSVSDNGIGMSPDTIQKIFEPYFTTKEKGKGTGLGLAVIYGIVKEHKGEIKVHSEIGKGTTFKVYLPLMKKSSEIVTADNMITAATGTESILLVDDEVSVAKLEGQILSRLGYHVTIKTKSSDALNVFRANSNSFDMLISDMTMPGMTGDQLSKEILSIKPNTPIIICTGFSERINKEQAEIIGVKGFLMKPVVKSDMAQMVRKILDESKKC